MAKIVNTDCFKGFHKIALQCYTEENMKCYIDQYEEEFLNEILGCELAALICEYIDNDRQPKEDRLDLIIDKFCKKSQSTVCGCGKRCPSQSKGLKWALTGLIYNKYVRAEAYTQGTGGATRVRSSNSERVSNINIARIGEIRHNDAILTVNEIQKCIESNIEEYPEYGGCEIDPEFQGII